MSISNRNLRVVITGALNINYYRTDIPISGQGVSAGFNYTRPNRVFQHGSGEGKCNLLHFSTRNLNNAVEIINLNGGLSNYWGDELNFNSIKVIHIENKETTAGRFLQVRFKNEIMHIGPGGSRRIIEPKGAGISSFVSSQSSEEGSLVLSTDTDVTFDLIVAGSSDESSSSSGA
jgi:hypothetical protein